MNHKLSLVFSLLITLVFAANSSCSMLAPPPTPTPTASPTLTQSPTATHTPTPTLTPTNTPIPINTPTFTPTRTATHTATPAISCDELDGEWKSRETASSLFAAPLLTFHITRCKVDSFDVWSFLLKGELYVMKESVSIPILDHKFSYTKVEGGGSVIIEGEFTSPTSSQGTITFTKGLFFVDFTLDHEVIIPWTASPTG